MRDIPYIKRATRRDNLYMASSVLGGPHQGSVRRPNERERRTTVRACVLPKLILCIRASVAASKPSHIHNLASRIGDAASHDCVISPA